MLFCTHPPRQSEVHKNAYNWICEIARGGEEAKEDRGRIGRGVAGEEVEEKLSSSATSCSSAFNFRLTDLLLKSLTSRLLHLGQRL